MKIHKLDKSLIQSRIKKHFCLLPKRIDDETIIWLENIYIIQRKSITYDYGKSYYYWENIGFTTKEEYKNTGNVNV